MTRKEVRAFARLIRGLSCKQLQGLHKKLIRRLKIASAGGGLMLFFRRKLIKSLKTKIKMVKSRIKVKCSGGSSSGGVLSGLGGRLKECQRKAREKYPMPSGGGFGSIVAKARVLRLRKQYIKKCMRINIPGTGVTTTNWWQGMFNTSTMSSGMRAKLSKCVSQATKRFPLPTSGAFLPIKIAQTLAKRKSFVRSCMGSGGFLGGNWGQLPFDGGYSNQAGTIPGQPFTSIPRPSGPPVGGWPGMTTTPRPRPRPSNYVPYHTHRVEETSGYTTSGPIASPYRVPVPRPINKVSPQLPAPTPTTTGPVGGLLPSGPNFSGNFWADDIDMR